MSLMDNLVEGLYDKWNDGVIERADIRAALIAVVKEERERCAQTCEDGSADPNDWGMYYAGEIRARGTR